MGEDKSLAEILGISENEGEGNRGEQNKDGGEAAGGGSDEELRKELKEAKRKNAELEEKLGELDDVVLSDDFAEFMEQKKGKAGKEGGGEEQEEEVDLDMLTNRQLHDRFQKQVEERVNEVEEKYEERYNQLAQYTARQSAVFDLRLAMQANPELREKLEDEDFQEKFQEVAEEHPKWNTEKVYKQIQLEEKAEEEETKQEQEERAKRELKARMEKQGAPLTAEVERDLSDDDAAELAHREAFGTSSEEEEE